jgi:hypothetical protein
MATAAAFAHAAHSVARTQAYAPDATRQDLPRKERPRRAPRLRPVPARALRRRLAGV